LKATKQETASNPALISRKSGFFCWVKCLESIRAVL